MLDNVSEVKTSLAEGRLCLGTADSFLLRSLTSEPAEQLPAKEDVPLHVTDVTHAALTGLLSLETLQWDPKLCQYYGVPISTLPKIRYVVRLFLDKIPEHLPTQNWRIL